MAENNKKGSSCGVIFGVIVIICIVYACNSGSSSKNSNDNNKTTVTEQVTSAQSQFVNAFSGILKSGYKFHALYTTKSKDFRNVYIIGGVVEKNGEYYSCIWYSNSIQARNGSLTGLTFSFDDAAFEVSGMGKANKVNSWDDGVSRIKEKLAEEMQKIEEQNKKGL